MPSNKKRAIDKGPKRRRKQVNYLPPFKPKDAPADAERIVPDELILTVALYHSKRPQKTQGFRVLASQYMTELRDRFYCLNDHILCLDGPNMKSGFFFIENTFYNDLRDGRIDYSVPILSWLHKRPGQQTKYLTADMETSRFMDANISIGKRYLYCHQGDCEHWLVFEEVRKIVSGDTLLMMDYPLQVYQCKISRRKCQICNIFPGKYVTNGDKLAPASPALFCEDCYRLLHYDQGGILLYDDFTVFEYHHK